MKSLQNIITSPGFQGERTSRLITKLFGWLAVRRFPKPVLRYLIKKYAAAFDVNLHEYDFEVDRALTFQEFFLRKFKEGKRPFYGNVAAPAEGVITAGGELKKGKLMQVKGRHYQVDTLLEESGFLEGSYATIYLGLGDYHHVHMPFDATIEKVKRVKGSFFATNEKALHQKERVYCLNERLILRGKTSSAQFILVLVGATCVGKIRLNSAKLSEEKPTAHLKQGDEIAAFEMGSTVILILDNQKLTEPGLKTGRRVLLGEKLAD